MRKIKVALIGTNILSHAMPVFLSVLKQSDIFEFVGYNFPEGEKENPYSYDYELLLYKTILKCCGRKDNESDTCK